MLETRTRQWLPSCYIRPIALRGYGENWGKSSQESCYVYRLACGNWGKYLRRGSARRRRRCLCIELDTAWRRTRCRLGQGGRQLHELPVNQDGPIHNGYSEGIALDGPPEYVSEGSGANIFVRARWKRFDSAASRPPSFLEITRDTVIQLARDLGFPLIETSPARDLYIAERKILLAAPPPRSRRSGPLTKIQIGKGVPRPVA